MRIRLRESIGATVFRVGIAIVRRIGSGVIGGRFAARDQYDTER